ncbi:tyrosine-type recombinase/integrase [Streptomyces rubiginosohelvolus]|uniref:tyrosine-type recombinase/integrase n=1 Tax=Streptomyces rubiginosohelvolus TaxID=67362 RepID=UPI0033B2C9F2
MHALFDLALHTGLRKSELLGLRWEDLDFNTGRCLSPHPSAHRHWRPHCGCPPRPGLRTPHRPPCPPPPVAETPPRRAATRQ